MKTTPSAVGTLAVLLSILTLSTACLGQEAALPDVTATEEVAAFSFVPPLVMECPADLTVWTCGTSRVQVWYPPATVLRSCDTNVVITFTPASGSLFPLGTNTVRCQAQDGCGNRDTCSFLVIVREDGARPKISCPGDLRVCASARGGAYVQFPVTAFDNSGGEVVVRSDPPSGSWFPLGATTVRCMATDSCGNEAQCSFQVTVFEPSLRLTRNLRGQIVLEWSDCGTLQAASDVTGPWQSLPEAASPVFMTVITSRQRFYRLRCCDAGAEVRIVASDNTRFRSTITFGLPTLLSVRGGGQDWVRVEMPGLELSGGQAGQPAVPVFRKLLAVPQGARVRLASVLPSRGQDLFLKLYPYQPLRDEASLEIDDYIRSRPPDALYAPQPFVVDTAAYQGANLFPEAPARITSLGTVRDLSLALLECAAGQYRPSSGTLSLFDAMEVEVAFEGGTGDFFTEASINPFDSATRVVQGAVLNQAVVGRYVARDLFSRAVPGEELLILTHPNYRAAADKLAQWRCESGMPTGVFNVNDGADPGPDTKEQIRAFIRQRYTTGIVRPSYILILGDSGNVPTWLVQRINKAPGEMVATDFPYATLDSDPTNNWVYLADFALGRIPVNSAAEAQTVVDKILQYEKNPPWQPGIYRQTTIASYFECCKSEASLPGVEDNRAFVQHAEHLLNQLGELGFAVRRIYSTSTNYHADYSGDPTPRYYSNGSPLPAPLTPGSGFAWTGGTQDILDAFHQPSPFFFHVDHGYTQGWGDPPFDQVQVANLTNNVLWPVVFSMNCSSGKFDSTCLAETLLRRAGGGAIGVFGFTRMSNPGYYQALLDGALDALWPGVLPDFGQDWPQPCLGDILNQSKAYMMVHHVAGDPLDPANWNTVNHVRLFHLLGDPTLRPWTDNPLTLPHDLLLYPLPNYLEIHYPEEGAVITALQQVVGAGLFPVGRGVVQNGVARLRYVVTPSAGPLQLTASKPNAITARLTP